MKIVQLDAGRLPDFLEYCRRHRSEVDDSFLVDEDLEEFSPDGENPTVIAVDDSGRLAGVGSLAVNDHMRRGNHARVRILHAESGHPAVYDGMFRALLPHLAGLGHLYCFVPDRNREQMDAFARLGFVVDRYSVIMIRENQPVPEGALPEGISIGPCVTGRDEQAWCDVRNAAFSTLRGNETPVTAEMAAKQLFGEGSLDGGALMLRCGRTTVGVVCVGTDKLDGEPVAEIGSMAILPNWQGRGLGRCLLRAALRCAIDKGFGKTVLCVNAENERATGLYEREGFRKIETAICFDYKLPL